MELLREPISSLRIKSIIKMLQIPRMKPYKPRKFRVRVILKKNPNILRFGDMHK